MEDDEKPHPLRIPPTLRNFDSLIDKLVNQARSEGQFDNLPGEGKPQALDDDLLVPEEDRLGYRMLKSNGFAPPWIEEQRAIDEERARVSAWLRQTNGRWARMQEPARTAARAEYRQMLEEVQRMITNYNLRAPAAAGQLEGIHIANELARLGSKNSDC